MIGINEIKAGMNAVRRGLPLFSERESVMGGRGEQRFGSARVER